MNVGRAAIFGKGSGGFLLSAASKKWYSDPNLIVRALVLCVCMDLVSAKDSQPYTIIDSGVWSSKAPPPSVYWIDNKRVLFSGSEDSTYKSASRPSISIWEVGKGVATYKKDAIIKCYQSGTLWYVQRSEGSAARDMRGPLGKEALYEIPTKKESSPGLRQQL